MTKRPDPEPDYGTPDLRESRRYVQRQPLAYRIGYYVLAPLVVLVFLVGLFGGVLVLMRIIGENL